ncbi:hypothetical protein L228DRAFT_92726 [Xylona heveae TC161]|uniref:Uncharacterized protein n=1 Tax=Xylona heveae (strain CBS 132557 / TC161) TaxID=1328760 RepID=A0A165I274_XYLHT|nr:hypothetical protein L228DRAFT_92726 [Xylona heveae TC161]KZF24259.1 hypothetical protein L228DRAFT_92726 [Xylona heveae TC161]
MCDFRDVMPKRIVIAALKLGRGQWYLFKVHLSNSGGRGGGSVSWSGRRSRSGGRSRSRSSRGSSCRGNGGRISSGINVTVGLSLRALAGDMTHSTAAVAGLAGGVKGTAVGGGAVAGDVALLLLSVDGVQRPIVFKVHTSLPQA